MKKEWLGCEIRSFFVFYGWRREFLLIILVIQFSGHVVDLDVTFVVGPALHFAHRLFSLDFGLIFDK